MGNHRGGHRRPHGYKETVTSGYDDWAKANTPREPAPRKDTFSTRMKAKMGSNKGETGRSQTVTRIIDMGSTALLTGIVGASAYVINRMDKDSQWAPLVWAAASGMPIPTILTVGTTLVAEKLGASSGVARGAGAAIGTTGVAVETVFKVPDTDVPYTPEIQHEATEAGLSAVGGIGAVAVASAIMAHGWKNRR